MTPNEYQKEALRTEQCTLWIETDIPSLRLLNGLMGLNGEAGEAIDILKKNLFQILQMNVNKLRERYPDGFDSDKSVNRKEGDI